MSTSTAPTATATSGDLTRGLLAASVAVTAWGAAGIIAKWLPLGALAIAAWRFAAYFVLIGGWRVARGHRLSWHAFKHSIFGGLLLASDVALFFTAIKLTTVVNATIIGALQPLILTLYGTKFMGETVTRRDIGLGLVALGGVCVIVFAGSNSGDASLLGDLAALGALVSWSGYFVFAKKADGVVSPTDFTLSAAIIVAAVNAPLALIFGQSMAWPSLEHWAWILVMAIGAGLLGHNLMNWSIVRIPLWLGSTMTLMVPIVSSGIAWLVLDEPLNAIQIAAMFVTVLAIAALVWFQSIASSSPDESKGP